MKAILELRRKRLAEGVRVDALPEFLCVMMCRIVKPECTTHDRQLAAGANQNRLGSTAGQNVSAVLRLIQKVQNPAGADPKARVKFALAKAGLQRVQSDAEVRKEV